MKVKLESTPADTSDHSLNVFDSTFLKQSWNQHLTAFGLNKYKNLFKQCGSVQDLSYDFNFF